jgi:Tol biopolymer transport system component
MRPDGSRERRLTRSYEIYEDDPTWTPDGRWIVFHRATGRTGGIHRIRPDGTGLRRLAPGSDPAVSPDGRWLLFPWLRNEQQDLYRTRLDGSGLAQLTGTVGVEEWAPTWQRR